METPVFDMELPYSTMWFSLPILGIAVAHLGPWDNILFYVYWSCLFAYPVTLAVTILRVTEKESLLSVWVVGVSLYLALVTLLSILVVFGLWAPFLLS